MKRKGNRYKSKKRMKRRQEAGLELGIFKTPLHKEYTKRIAL